MQTKNDSDVIFCLKIDLHTPLELTESIDHLCINPILGIGLKHKRSIDYKFLITLLTKHNVTVILGRQDSSYNLFTSTVLLQHKTPKDHKVLKRSPDTEAKNLEEFNIPN